jgi:hypothetical protein
MVFAFGTGSKWVTIETMPPNPPLQRWELFRVDEEEGALVVRTIVYKAAVEGLWLVDEFVREQVGERSSEDIEEADNDTSKS